MTAAGNGTMEDKYEGVLVPLTRFEGVTNGVNRFDGRGLVGSRIPCRGFPVGEAENELGQLRDRDHVGVVIDQEFEGNSGASAERSSLGHHFRKKIEEAKYLSGSEFHKL